MQSVDIPVVRSSETYNLRQRMMSGSLTLAVAGSFTGSYAAMANTGFATHASAPAAIVHHAGASGSAGQGALTFGTSATTHSATASFTHNLMNTWNNAHTTVPSLTNAAPGVHDLSLNSARPQFDASTLAGFHDITINIGGRQVLVTAGTQLTGAELVAAQQVLSSGKQEIIVNGRGVATGGVLDLNNATLSALNTAVGGQIGSLYISHGVKAVDSLTNLSLLGNLVNMGNIVLTTDGGSAQSTDTISAVNIYNGFGGSITSAILGGLTPTSIALDASVAFYNVGHITSAGDLSISAPNINNSGLLAATAGNVNFSGGAGSPNINFNNTNGTVQALNGAINFNQAGYAGISNINVLGGDFLSNQVNFNAGTGNVEVNAGNVTGVINGTAGCAHVTTASNNMNLGKLDVSGDPTYYNTAGDITINSDISTVGANALGIIASGNIIGNGGKITTASGQLNLIAGANFVTPTTGSSLPGGGGDTATTITIGDSGNAGKGSKTGGYIDLSGITLTNKTTNTAVTGVGSTSGNVLMVAYKGSGTNSGSIVATRSTKQAAGADTLDAGTGTVTIIAGGSQITAQKIKGGDTSIFATVPVLGGTMDIKDGAIIAGGYVTTGTPTAAALNFNTTAGVTALTSTGNITLSTAGKPNGTAALPISIDAKGISVTGTGSTSSYFLNSVNAGKLTVNTSSAASGSTVSLVAAGDVDFAGNLGGAATVKVSAPVGMITNSGGIISGNTANLSSAGKIDVKTAVNTLSAVSSTASVTIDESASSAKVLNLSASGAVPGQTFKLTSTQTVNVNGGITAGDIDLTETGSTNAIGLNIKSTLNSSTGNIFLTTKGTDTIQGSKPVVATNVTITAGGAVGTSGAGFQTQATNLVVNGNAVANTTPLVNIKDLSKTTLTLSGVASGLPQSITVNSAAATLNVDELKFTNVTLSDTVTASQINIAGAAGKDVGNGAGIVKVTGAGNIDNTGAGTLKGTSVTVSSTGANIGSVGKLLVTTPLLAASATKGSVTASGATAMTLNAGSAKTSYTIDAPSITVGGTISTTTTLTGLVSLTGTGAGIFQGPVTAVLSSANVQLNTTANGASIGIGTGGQSIQTKAVTSLVVNTLKSTNAFVTNTGNLTLAAGADSTGGTGSSLNLALAAGNKLTLGSTLAFDNVTITAPLSFTLGATGLVSGINLTVNSPTQVFTAGGQLKVVSPGSLSLTSPGLLTVNGPTSTVSVFAGSSLNLSGQSGITLGTAGANDPLNALITGVTLNNLTIFTKGVFTGNYNSLATSTALAGNTLSVTASSLKNSGPAVGTPFALNSNNVTLALTGGATTVLGTAPVTPGTTPNFDITSSTAGSFVSVTSGGKLVVAPAGLKFTGTGNSIALKGLTLDTNAVTNPLYFTTLNKFASVSLQATSGIFTVGATGTQLNNGILGGADGFFLTISAPTINVNNQPLSGTVMTFNTNAFNLNGTSTVTGDSATNSLTISGAGALTIGGTGGANKIGGTYNNIQIASFQASGGNVNTGKLFTNLNGTGLMLDNKTLTNLTLSASGNVILNSAVSTIATQDNGSIYLGAAALSYSPLISNPQPFLTLSANKGNVTMYLGSDLKIGAAAGNIDVQVGATGSVLLSSQGNLTINESQTVASATLFGNNIAVNQSVTSSGLLNIQTFLTPTSTITEGVGAVLTAKSMVVSQGLTSNPTALNISTSDLHLLGGALAFNNNFAGNVNVQQDISTGSLYSLSLVNTSGLGGSTLTLGSIFANSGGINIVNNNGTIFVNNFTNLRTNFFDVPGVPPAGGGAAVPVQTQGGNITLQNNDLAGSIVIGTGSQIIANGRAGSGLGNVYIVMGPVPTTSVAGTQSSPTPTVNTTSNGGQIFFTTTANPTGSITSLGTNTLNAKGANIVFNGAGNNTAIVLLGTQIIADPPAAGAVSTAATPATTLVNTTIAPAATSNVATVSAPTTTVSAPAEISNVNWSLPAITALNASLHDGVTANVAGLSDSTVLSGRGGLRVARASNGMSAHRVLTGGVATDGVQTMDEGVTLISPKTDTTIKTGFGSVDVAAGAVAMIMSYDGGMAVYNLHDTKSGAVVVKVGANKVRVSPGQNIVLTSRSVRSFEDINPGQAIAYRRVVAKDWGNGVQAFHSEFSILSMLQNYGAVRELVKSQDAETRKTVDAMLKTSAILLQIGGEKYEYMKAPAVTAMR